MPLGYLDTCQLASALWDFPNYKLETVVSQPIIGRWTPIGNSPEKLFPGNRDECVEFLAELESLRSRWIGELLADDATASWVDPANLDPHGRLVQLLDGLSLSLCSVLIPGRNDEADGLGEDEFELQNVPRRSWEDRVTIEVSPSTERRIILEPYPFDMDPLPVSVPVRVFKLPADCSGHFQTWWNTRPMEILEFLYSSG